MKHVSSNFDLNWDGYIPSHGFMCTTPVVSKVICQKVIIIWSVQILYIWKKMITGVLCDSILCKFYFFPKNLRSICISELNIKNISI